MTDLLSGSDALVHASIAAGCRFFAGYPMTPATKLLEGFAKHLPEHGGVCVNAESELEAVGMVWGAAAAGARAATGSTGQGLALMQESFSELAMTELPLVIFNMSRGQGDYFQSTRGGGHGDYRHIVLAPIDITEGAALTILAFDLADRWRIPVLVLGDYLLGHAYETVEITTDGVAPAPPKEWALDGSTSGSGRAKIVSPYGIVKGAASNDEQETEAYDKRVFAKYPKIQQTETRIETRWLDDADVVVTAWGSTAKFVRYAVAQLRERGHRIGFVRPITLWPFPTDAVAAAAEQRSAMLVFELNLGQMVDDVRLAVLGRCPVHFIGDYTMDTSNFGLGPLLNVDVIRDRILEATLNAVGSAKEGNA
jgi:2-oxoglutarate ferredoxin oxidoreductase subunit alpha